MTDVALAEGVRDLMRELIAIVTLTSNTLAALADDDPRRDDLIDVYSAARLAMTRLQQLGCTAPALRVVAS